MATVRCECDRQEDSYSAQRPEGVPVTHRSKQAVFGNGIETVDVIRKIRVASAYHEIKVVAILIDPRTGQAAARRKSEAAASAPTG